MAKDTNATLADLQRAKARLEEEIGARLLDLERAYGVIVYDVEVNRNEVWSNSGDPQSVLEGVKLTLKL